MLYNSWSVSVRKLFRLDRKTHRYLIEPVSEMDHLKCAIEKRFISFAKKLAQSPKKIVRDINNMIGKDCRSTTGSNLRHILLERNSDPISGPAREDISKCGFAEIPSGQEWRVCVIRELIEIRDGIRTAVGWSPQQLQEALTQLCTT